MEKREFPLGNIYCSQDTENQQNMPNITCLSQKKKNEVFSEACERSQLKLD